MTRGLRNVVSFGNVRRSEKEEEEEIALLVEDVKDLICCKDEKTTKDRIVADLNDRYIKSQGSGVLGILFSIYNNYN